MEFKIHSEDNLFYKYFESLQTQEPSKFSSVTREDYFGVTTVKTLRTGVIQKMSLTAAIAFDHLSELFSHGYSSEIYSSFHFLFSSICRSIVVPS